MDSSSKSTRVSQRLASMPKKGVSKRPSQPRSGKKALPVDQRRRSTRTTNHRTAIGKRVVKLQKEDLSQSKDVKKDPMQVLHNDVIALIILCLDPAGTETMRRVSKLWKAISEYHCGNGLLLIHFPAAHSIHDSSMSGKQANLVYRRRLYRSENLKRGMATRAVNITNVRGWHINGDRLVYRIEPSGICVRTLRGPNGEACKVSEPTTFKLKKKIGDREMGTVYVQSLKDGDLLITACSSSAGIPDALHKDTFLMRASLREERMKYYSNLDLGQFWYGIDEDNLAFRIELNGQIICRPALGRDCAYFVQNRSSDESKSQPRFTKVSITDGTILFSQIMPEIKQAGRIHDDGRSFMAELSDDAKVSKPGRAIDVPGLDKQLALTRNEDLAIWSDAKLRMYVFCTDTGTLLYTYDCLPKSSITMSTFENGFWYTYCRAPVTGRHFTHHFCSFSKEEGRVLFGPPLLQDGGPPALMDDKRIDVHVERQRYNWGPPQPLGVAPDHPTRFRISTMARRKYRLPPHHSRQLSMPGAMLPIADYEKVDYLMEEARCLPCLSVTLDRGTRYLEAEIPLSGSNGDDEYQMVNGYLIYSNATNKQLILIDFYPEW